MGEVFSIICPLSLSTARIAKSTFIFTKGFNIWNHVEIFFKKKSRDTDITLR